MDESSDVKVSTIHLPDGSTGVSLLVPLGEVTSVHVGDRGRVLAASTQRDVPPVAVGLTPAAARSLAASLVAQADEIEPPPVQPRICIDADCPACGHPERWFDLTARIFGCSKCTYRSDQRDA